VHRKQQVVGKIRVFSHFQIKQISDVVFVIHIPENFQQRIIREILKKLKMKKKLKLQFSFSLILYKSRMFSFSKISKLENKYI